MRIVRLSLPVALLALAGGLAAFAGTTGKISGVVLDQGTSEALPGVNVVVDGTSLGASTDIDGRYTILNVPPGRHTVIASFIGYRRFEIGNIQVSVDFTTTLDISLTEGSVELDAIVVQADRTPLIRQDLTNPVASITSENIDVLPVLEISEVIGLQAGVIVDDDGSIHIRGGLGNEIAYTLNGVSINNPYGNARSVGIATNAVQEVSVSSGTFNAEYGGALSGVVNYITKEGGPQWRGSIKYLTGDYASDGEYDDDRPPLFFDIGTFNLATVNRLEASLGGPIISEDLTVFASGVYNWDRGWLTGERLYAADDSYLSRESFPADDPRRGSSSDPYYFAPLRHDTLDQVGLPTGEEYRLTTGDSYEKVALNWTKSWNTQANLSLRVTPEMKLRYEFVYDYFERPGGTAFAHRYKPDGRALAKDDSYIHALDFTHTVSASMFYSVKLSYGMDIATTRAFDDPYDPRYLPDFYLRTFPNTAYLTGGVDPDRFYRRTRTIGGNFDLVAQASTDHELKAGVEVRSHMIDVESYTLQFRDPSDTSVSASFTNALAGYTFLPYIPSVEGGYVKYLREPLQFTAYIQDKIELWRSVILNLGLRYDYFDPAADYNTNISDELAAGQSVFLSQNLVAAEVKHMVQPRISVSYPITDQGSIRFSYGHFFQVGNLASLYSNPYYRAPSGTSPTFGNPNVEPQRSIQYELGLQQGLTEDMKVEITGYYKDVNNYIYSQRVLTERGDKEYFVLTNLAYANTRGISVSLLKRRAPGGILAASVDYTFQVAEGNRTEPLEEVFYNEQAGRLSETYLVPQDFDRSHTLTSTLALGPPEDWIVSFIGYLRTGTPYTPSFPTNIADVRFVQNSDDLPVQWNVDVKAEKFFDVGAFDLSIFVQVDNLFDTRNELFVYENSGRALYSIDEVQNPSRFGNMNNRIARGDPGMVPQSAINEYYANPANVSRPRLVRLGASLVF
jgi:outer membrane receptor protein involved in Fe transport